MPDTKNSQISFKSKKASNHIFGVILPFTLLLAFTLGCSHRPTIDMKSDKTSLLIHGHRGARGLRPENTIAAFKYALEEVEVDVLELDLSVSKDGELIVTHDPYIDPVICLDPKGRKLKEPIPTISLTLKEIQSFDCGRLVNPRFPKQKTFPGEKIPTLSEVFEFVRNSKSPMASKVLFNIETKLVPSQEGFSAAPERFAKLVFDVVKKYELEDRVVLQSFDHRTLVEIKKLSKKIKTSGLLYGNFFDLTAVAKAADLDYISPNWEWINEDSVRALHKIGVRVAPWTANDEKSWDYLIQAGVDDIITDYPAELKKYLQSKGLYK